MKINKKGDNMNNFKKVGLSALAGSLAAISAQAAEVSWSGYSTVAYTDNESNGSDANAICALVIERCSFSHSGSVLAL